MYPPPTVVNNSICLIIKHLRKMAKKIVGSLAENRQTGANLIGRHFFQWGAVPVSVRLQYATAIFHPCPRLAFLNPGGYRLSVETPKVLAKRNNSSSDTHRIWASICEMVPRLMSRPCNWHLAANASWVKASSYRRFWTCLPTTLAGFLVLAMFTNSALTIRGGAIRFATLS